MFKATDFTLGTTETTFHKIYRIFVTVPSKEYLDFKYDFFFGSLYVLLLCFWFFYISKHKFFVVIFSYLCLT